MAIKNFKAARKNSSSSSSSNTPEAIKVKDYMTTKLITFRPEDTINNVIESLIKYKISGAPVVNENQELVGMISEGDCIKQISDSRYYNQPMETEVVSKRMVSNVETIDGEMNVFDAAQKFLTSKRRRFPIVNNGKLVGQISQKDILKAALNLKGQTW